MIDYVLMPQRPMTREENDALTDFTDAEMRENKPIEKQEMNQQPECICGEINSRHCPIHQ